MFCQKDISVSLIKKSGKKAKKEASEMSTVVATVSVVKEKAPVYMVGPGFIRLPIQDHILANPRVKASDT